MVELSRTTRLAVESVSPGDVVRFQAPAIFRAILPAVPLVAEAAGIAPRIVGWRLVAVVSHLTTGNRFLFIVDQDAPDFKGDLCRMIAMSTPNLFDLMGFADYRPRITMEDFRWIQREIDLIFPT